MLALIGHETRRPNLLATDALRQRLMGRYRCNIRSAAENLRTLAEAYPGTQSSDQLHRAVLSGLTIKILPHNICSDVLAVEAMEDEKKPQHSNVRYIKRPKRLVSRTRLVMGLLLIVAIPIFIGLANKAVRENAEAIQRGFGR